MKTILLTFIFCIGLIACNNKGGTGDRTYDLNTPHETGAGEAENPTTAGDTTATTNNNIYNKDSPAGKSAFTDTGTSVGSKDVSPKAH